MAIALLAAALASLCQAQPAQPTNENQARYYVYGAFLTHAVPEIMGERVTLGSELEQRLGVASGADRRSIYDALMTYTDGKRLAVRKATPEEIASYRSKRELKAPVFTVQAGEIALLVEYDMRANTIPYVGQLRAPVEPPRAAAPPVIEQRAAPPPAPVAPAPAPQAAPVPVVPPPAVPVAPAPKPAPAVAAIQPKPAPVRTAPAKPAPVRAAPPPVAPAETLRPNGPCVVMPVMSEQDLANCRPASGATARVAPPPPPPPVVKPQASVAPLPQPQRTGPCEVKPVMTDEDLANCRAAPGGSARIDPGPAPRPQVRAEPQPQQRQPARPCEIKPVMTEEDRIACGIR